MAVKKTEVNSTGSLDAIQVYGVNKTTTVTLNYIVLDNNGDGDNVRYKRQVEAYESVLGDRGIGDELIAEMRSCCVNVKDHIEVADWMTSNSDYMKELFERHGYRMVEVLEWRKS